MMAATLGVVAGIVFAWLWLWVVPWAVHWRFFRRVSALARDILKVDELRAFLGLYGKLLADTARYVGRNLAGTAVAGAPLVAFFLLAEAAPVPFFTAFVTSMMLVFCWPRLWPTRTAF